MFIFFQCCRINAECDQTAEVVPPNSSIPRHVSQDGQSATHMAVSFSTSVRFFFSQYRGGLYRIKAFATLAIGLEISISQFSNPLARFFIPGEPLIHGNMLLNSASYFLFYKKQKNYINNFHIETVSSA